jgi:hypothetical protein
MSISVNVFGKEMTWRVFFLRKYSEINNIISIIKKKCLRIDNKRYKKTDYKINPEVRNLGNHESKDCFLFS